MLRRAAILAACALAIVLLGRSVAASDACQAARKDLLGVVVGGVPPDREAPALRTIEGRCRGTEALVAASAAVERQGRLRLAVALAQRAVGSEPDSATGWDALRVAASAAGRRALAARAAATEARLSPLGRPPAQAPPAARGRAGAAGGP